MKTDQLFEQLFDE